MLLYRHARGHYLAVPPAMRFAPAAGYTICFDGRDVPDVICAAFLAESGGSVLHEQDTIELRAPRPAAPARPPRARGVRRQPPAWRRRLAGWLQPEPRLCHG